MPFSLLLALAAVAGATTLTYLYDREASLWPRLCAGVCVGFAALGLFGFALASALGMTPAALALAGFVAASPLLLLANEGRRARLRADAGAAGRAGKGRGGALVFYLALAAVFWLVFANAMYRNAEGVFTGLDTNIGDMPFHVSLVTGFAHGDNFPPEHTEFAGAKLTYPFVADFVTAMFVRAGATLEGAFFWQNFVTMMALVGLLHRWALKLTGDRAAAVIAALLVLFSGGFGWYVFVGEAASGGRGVFGQLNNLAHDYTRIPQGGYAWANAVTALFVPQRGIMLGVGLALVVWTVWWDQTARGKKPEDKREVGARKSEADAGLRKKKGKKAGRGDRAGSETPARYEHAPAASITGVTQSGPAAFPASLYRRLSSPSASPTLSMAAAGVIAGLLPLVHAHSFVVMMAMGGCLALLQMSFAWRGTWDGATARAHDAAVGAVGDKESGGAGARVMRAALPWAAFAAAATLVAAPQLLWATSGSAVRPERFFGWEFGWDNGAENVLWFWLKNTAVFMPLLAVALLWRGDDAPVPRRLLYFYLPFTLCFVVPNVCRLSPWVWDNIKILFYWWVASAPLVALVLALLWRKGARGKAAALALVFAQTFAGGLDVWRAASGAAAHRTFDAGGLAFAEMIKGATEPRALILHAPTYNDPVYLSGRRTFLGYTGHVWSHGLDYGRREAELKRIYAGAPDAGRLLAQNGIDYVVVGPLERAQAGRDGFALDENYFTRYEKVGEAGEYRLYKTRP